MKKPPPIRILIADDHAIVREGLSSILTMQDDFQVVAQAVDGEEAVALFHRHHPDILLLDLRMPKKDGLEVIAKLISEASAARIIIITTSDGDDDIRRALKAGARAYLLKDAPRQEIWDTIRLVHGGRSSLSPSVAARIAESMSHPELSAREKEVLEQVALGRTNKEIGLHLHIAEGTVKTHVKSILGKLGATTRTEAIAIATRRGLISRA